MNPELIEKVFEIAGGPTALAAKLDPPDYRQNVTTWKERGRVPAHRVLDVERITGISRHVLRPDVFGEGE